MTLRQQFHVASSVAEAAAVNLAAAQTAYDEARDALNVLIDTATPIEHPDMQTDAERFAHRKISLIKLVREATAKFHKSLNPDAPFGCMSLKDAKELVEEWITSLKSGGL